MTSPVERITAPGQKRLLAIDGGGIRGVLALEILARIEEVLGKGRPEFRLSQYFDYIAGTSTGAIIAAGLARGMKAAEITAFYLDAGAQMFERANLLDRLKFKFKDEPLARKLQEVFGPQTTLGSPTLQSLLLLVLRNATTDSPWPISSNPFAKYNDPGRPDCNLNLPLWQLVRASTAAPTYFPPEVIEVGPRQFVFVDGGVTMYNDPAFQLFLMATVDRYWPKAPEGKRGWATGRDRMLLVSVGTGTSSGARSGLDPDEMNLLFNVSSIPGALMYAALNEQDLLCRVFGDCLSGDTIDRELGDLIGSSGPLAAKDKLFTYVRYNAELSAAGLARLGCHDVMPEAVQKLDAVESIPQLRKVGREAARAVLPAHFVAFPG
ncbi:MAG: patatin-like phospholipase family protein [Geminicoccaceae bacterium]